MPHPDQFFYKSLRSSPRGVDVANNSRWSRAASPKPQLQRSKDIAATTPRRAKTPVSAAAKRPNTHHNGIVPSSNITTSAPAISQLDNQFSAANVHQRSTPSFVSSPSRHHQPQVATPTSVAGCSLGSAADADNLRFQHQWSRSSSRSHGIRVGGGSRRDQRRDCGDSDALCGRDDDEIPMLQALERTLETEMEALRTLTDRLESRVASVMSLEDQRNALLRVLHHSRQPQQQASAAQRQSAPSHRSIAHDGGVGSPTGSSMRSEKPPASPSASYIFRNPEDADAPSMWEATPSPKRANTASLAVVRTAVTPPQAARGRQPSTSVGLSNDDVVVLSELGSAVSLTDSGRKRRDVHVGASNGDDAVLLRSAQRVAYQSPSRQRQIQSSVTDDEAIFVVDLSASGMREPAQHGGGSPKGETRNNVVAGARTPAHTAAPTLLEGTELIATAEGRAQVASPQRSPAAQPVSSAMLLTAQCNGTLADLLKYEEALLAAQDELIQLQREGRDADSEAERVLLMHLRVVVRDELSACKVRESTLRSMSDALESPGGGPSASQRRR